MKELRHIKSKPLASNEDWISRIKLICPTYNQSKTLIYDSKHVSALETIEQYLTDMGFKIVGFVGNTLYWSFITGDFDRRIK